MFFPNVLKVMAFFGTRDNFIRDNFTIFFVEETMAFYRTCYLPPITIAKVWIAGNVGMGNIFLASNGTYGTNCTYFYSPC